MDGEVQVIEKIEKLIYERYMGMVDFSKKMKQATMQKRENPIEIYSSLDRTSSAGRLRESQEMV